MKAKVKRAVIAYEGLQHEQLSKARAQFRQESMSYVMKCGVPFAANTFCAATPLQRCLLSFLAISSSHKACLLLHCANNISSFSTYYCLWWVGVCNVPLHQWWVWKHFKRAWKSFKEPELPSSFQSFQRIPFKIQLFKMKPPERIY